MDKYAKYFFIYRRHLFPAVHIKEFKRQLWGQLFGKVILEFKKAGGTLNEKAITNHDLGQALH